MKYKIGDVVELLNGKIVAIKGIDFVKEEYHNYSKDCIFKEDAIVGYAKKLNSPHNTQIAGDHYKNMCIQPSEFIQRNHLSWCEGNVIKYVCRHAHKNGVEDIDKAIHYLQLIKEWEYEE